MCVCECVWFQRGVVEMEVVVVSVLGQNAGEVLSQSFRDTLINKCFK